MFGYLSILFVQYLLVLAVQLLVFLIAEYFYFIVGHIRSAVPLLKIGI